MIETELLGANTLYDQVAQHIVDAIEGGSLQPGQRVPSVRRLSAQQNVSVSTVLQAYRVLENGGWIESRPQSGYYVRRRFLHTPPPEPETSRPTFDVTPVNVCEMAMEVSRATRRPNIIQLGAAVPAPTLLPLRQLDRSLSSLARRYPGLSGTYDVPPGCEALRIEIARRSVETGYTISPDEIVITSGCQEALHLCLRAVAEPGDTIVLESPTYYGSLQLIESLGLRALELPTHPREGISLSALEHALEHHEVKACLLMPNFSNPLGSCMPEANKKRLIEMLAERDIPLIEDDTYGDLGFAAARPDVAKKYDRNDSVLLCSSFSKTLAPGYRVGWVAPGRYQRKVERLKIISTFASATMPPLAIAEFLSTGGYDHHLRRARKIYAENIQVMSAAVGRYFPPGTCVTRPQGGFVLWVEMPACVQAFELFTAAIACGISIGPGPIFSAKGKYANCIRLNAGCQWSPELEKAIETLGKLAFEQVQGNRPARAA